MFFKVYVTFGFLWDLPFTGGLQLHHGTLFPPSYSCSNAHVKMGRSLRVHGREQERGFRNLARLMQVFQRETGISAAEMFLTQTHSQARVSAVANPPTAGRTPNFLSLILKNVQKFQKPDRMGCTRVHAHARKT